MKNLNIQLVLAATVFSFATAVSADTNHGQSNLILAGKNHDKHDNGDANDKNARSDTAITANVKAKFVQEKLFGDVDISAMTISVETTNGVVHLTGTADNSAQIKNAVKLAKSVEGVKGVVNKVKVKKNGDNNNDNGNDNDNDDKADRKNNNDSDHKY